MLTRNEISRDLPINPEMLSIAYGHLRLSSLIALVNALVLSAALWSVIEHHIITAWFASMLVVSILRYSTAQQFEHRYERFTHVQWEHIFLTGVVVSALIWASASVVLFSSQSIMHQAMLVIVLAGISSGAVSSLASVLPAIKIFLAVTLTPIIIRMLLEGTHLHYWVAFLLLLYLIAVLILSKRFNENSFKTVQSRLMYDRAKEALDLTSERFETVFREAPAGIFLYNAQLEIMEVNRELTEILEAPIEFLVGLDLKTVTDTRVMPALEVVTGGIDGFYEGEYHSLYKKKDIWISMRTSPVFDSKRDVIGGIAIVSDITERMHNQQKMQHQANYDALTDIPNRSMLMQRIQQELIRYKRHHIITGLLFLDLDHFKNINDSLGHHIGDELLIETALRLRAIIREEDMIARLGGDEFVILLPDLDSEPLNAISKAELIAQKVHRAFEKPFTIQSHQLSTTSSIGVVVTDDDNTTTQDLLKHADTAMYQAKKEGRGITCFYRPEMDRQIKRRLKVDNALRTAIAKNELKLHFQPITELSTGKIIGAETLLRWENTELGKVMPDEFIPIAEESGVIIGIGTWVLQEACREFVRWKSILPPLQRLHKISVNVSSKQFIENAFVDKVLDAIAQSGIEPGELELELTESIIIHNIEEVTNKMKLLRSCGVGISIDDFGTGYSSLSYLKKLPFSTLKIDKSFTQDIQHDADDADLISTIITIARNFNLNVIAEGVETYEQFAFLLENHCHCYQGYYCSRPLPQETFRQFLLAHNETVSV